MLLFNRLLAPELLRLLNWLLAYGCPVLVEEDPKALV